MQSVTGLSGLPEGGHLVVAPYATARQEATPEAGPGSPLENGSIEGDAGVDIKWTPGSNHALDATVNPDFSQVEADAAQIAVNRRFALFFPEKRPFFLEGVDLLETPIQAVYTRTITSPRWGLRATGKIGESAYTVLVTEDRGGGSVILPGPLLLELRPAGLQVDRRDRTRAARLRRLLRRPPGDGPGDPTAAATTGSWDPTFPGARARATR